VVSTAINIDVPVKIRPRYLVCCSLGYQNSRGNY
jgi:hypothetical protein